MSILSWAQETPMQRVPISMQQAIGKVNQTLSATFFRGALEKDGDHFQWSFSLKGPLNKPYEITVDAANGELLQINIVERSAKFEKDPPVTVALPLESALGAAISRQPGFVLEAEIDAEARNPNWNVKVLADDGAAHEVVVSGARPQVVMYDGVSTLGRRETTGHRVPMDEAAQTALTVVKGAFFQASLEKDENRSVWSFSLMAAGGVPYEVTIDADDGSLVQSNRVQYSAQLKKSPPKIVSLDISTAANIAARAVPGMAIEASTDIDEGKGVWDVTVIAQKDGSRHELEIGGARPHVLSMDDKETAKPDESSNQGVSRGRTQPMRTPRKRRRRGGG